MSFLGRLFGTEKSMEKAVDGLVSGLDKLVYTDEEKSEAVAADRSEARKTIIAWMGATQGQNLSRRILALSISSVWLSQYLIAWIMDTAVIWVTDPALAAKITESSNVIGERATQMNGAMMLILGFYFAAPYMGDLVKGAMNKFGSSK